LFDVDGAPLARRYKNERMFPGGTMSTTLSREATNAASFFKSKLEFEIGPYGVLEAIKAKEPVRIIDLRTPEYFAKGHVPGAVNVQFEDLPKFKNELNQDETAIVYCYDITCALSTRAALYLSEQGQKVKELVGGYEEFAKKEALSKAAQPSSCSTEKGSSCG
jgi:rhodanese-related sulfurtransferase